VTDALMATPRFSDSVAPDLETLGNTTFVRAICLSCTESTRGARSIWARRPSSAMDAQFCRAGPFPNGENWNPGRLLYKQARTLLSNARHVQR